MPGTRRTDAPLSSFRRGGIAALIYGDVATTFGHTVTVSAAASIHGVNGAFFHTDVWIDNPLGTALTVTATYHCYKGQSCGTGSATFNIDAGKAMTFPDIVSNLFGAQETAGAISFAYSSDSYVSTLRIVTRTYTPSLPNPTSGAVLEGRPAIDAVGAATFVGLGNNGGDRSAGFRTNAGLFNPAAFTTTVTFTLTATDGTPIGQRVTQTWGRRRRGRSTTSSPRPGLEPRSRTTPWPRGPPWPSVTAASRWGASRPASSARLGEAARRSFSSSSSGRSPASPPTSRCAGSNLRATVATTVPNFVRGAVPLITGSFSLLRGPLGYVGSAWAGRDLDFLE